MRKIKNILLGLSVLCFVSICFSDNYSFDQSCSYLFTGNANIGKPYNDNLSYNNSTKRVKWLTQNFCVKAYEMKCSDRSDGSYAVDYFDASQSIFLSVLCNSVGKLEGYENTNLYLKKKDFVDFGIVSSKTGYQESCYGLNGNGGSMNNCDYAYNLPLIFNEIMNDFFSIKQAMNFGITGLNEEFNADDAANRFSKIFPGKEMQNGICNPNNEYYKTTCKKLKGYMTDANNLLKNTSVISVTGLQARQGIDCENEAGIANNIVYCGLLGNRSDYQFTNAVYNEYFWYKVFLSYYSFYINGTDFIDNTKLDDFGKLEENQEKIYLVQNQLLKSKQAITLSLQSLSEMSYSFPLHIGFLMYHEDAKYFINNISKIYTPIRTLFDKLRNVQIKEE